MNRIKVGKIVLKILLIPLAVAGVWFFISQYAESKFAAADFAAVIFSVYLNYCVYTIGFQEAVPKIRGFFAPTFVYLGLYFVAALKYYSGENKVDAPGFTFSVVGLLALAGVAGCIFEMKKRV